jgi:hypothetical protein
MIGYVFRDGRSRRLVCEKSSPPQTPLACLLTIERAVCD